SLSEEEPAKAGTPTRRADASCWHGKVIPMFHSGPDHLAVSRFRRWRFWLLLGGLPLIVAGLAVIGWVAFAHGDLRRALAEADAQDPGWRLEDLEKARETPPTGRNAADRVIAAAKLQPGALRNMVSWNAARPLNLSSYADLDNLHPPALLNPQQVTALRT